jgi:glucose/arabinose dehydrogenase
VQKSAFGNLCTLLWILDPGFHGMIYILLLLFKAICGLIMIRIDMSMQVYVALIITLSLALILGLTSNSHSLLNIAYAAVAAGGTPAVKDPSLKIELVAQGLASPTSMAFLDNNNILVLQKEGTVQLISNGKLQPQPVLQVQVDSKNERGLLGIATMKEKGNTIANSSTTPSPSNSDVFLYYSESQGGKLVGNKVYKYLWDGHALVNPTLILDLPAKPGTNHQGGKLTLGPDNYLYAVIGELQRNGQLQNINDGPPPDDSGVIFRVKPADGSPAPNNPFSVQNKTADASSSTDNKLSRYYAYGIRNSFGLAFDPVTSKLWDTENGENSYDEINVVNSGFNSGWKKVMGPISKSGITEDQLVHFQGSKYADPVFSWLDSIGVTDIEFLKSSKLGANYENNIFVGDITKGNLYYFKVNENRTALKFDDKQPGLSDLVADNNQEVSAIALGTGFGGITDLETGPDGYLYILSYGNGSVYRIIPSS